MTTSTNQEWASGLQHEIDWWAGWLKTRGYEWPDRFIQKFDPYTPLELDDHDKGFLALPDAGEYFVLDVGAGPATLGKTLPGLDVKVMAVDPLGDHYSALLVQANMTAPIPTMRGAAEELVKVFGHNRFDLVTCRNALDHSVNPLLGLQQMLDVTRPGGDVFLLHSTNEGERVGYVGLHGFNFEPVDNRFRVWTRGGFSAFADEVLIGAERIHAEPTDRDWHKVYIRKAA
jgi:SAM-dependent methyltransferase